MGIMTRKLILILPLLATVPFAAHGADASPNLQYGRDIRPILSDHCFACHGPDKAARKGGLRLDDPLSARAALEGGAAASALFARIVHADADERMPPAEGGKPLNDQQIAKIAAWLDAGAPYEGHWAFIQPQRPETPAVHQTAWPITPVDHFILSRLEAEGIAPAPEADKVTLLRRAHLDITGLPPTVDQVDDFLRDSSPGAYERVIEQLLESPHFGERWGRHWLDSARYADSNGYSIDGERSIWPYRDWVIRAINDDMPFDQFTIEQFAGDLLPGATRDQIVATGFHRNTMVNQEGGIDPEEFRLEGAMDRVNTTGTVFLGLTLACARCHTHKYDPIEHTEYFRFLAFLNNDDEPEYGLPSPEDEEAYRAAEAAVQAAEAAHSEYLRKGQAARQPEWEDGLTLAFLHGLEPAQREALATPRADRSAEQQATILALYLQRDPEADRLSAELKRARREMPKVPSTLVLRARSKPRETRMLLAGDYTRPAEVLSPGAFAALHPMPEGATTRLDLVRWLVAPENPLTARVTVNRIWMRLFGRGIVETEDDFGTQGLPPTHPELLDWLATEFVDSGWRVKHLIKTLVTSATYRQSSHERPDLRDKDPRNLLLARQSRLRLDAEIIRDSSLSAAGILNPTIGGPSVFPPQPDGVMKLGQQSRPWNADEDENRFRRGLYTHFWRATPHPALTVFDAPDAQAACTRRTVSTNPLQALTLLNDPAYVEMAEALARRATAETDQSPPQRMRALFRNCLGRAPDDTELGIIEGLYVSALAEGGEEKAWLSVSRALLNLDEFITRE